MNVLNGFGKKEFLERFYSFGDAVVRQLEVHFSSRSKPMTNATVKITAQDKLRAESEKWSDVCFYLEGVKEFALHESPRASYIVITNDLHIGFFDDLTLLDFGGLTEEPNRVEEFRRSPFYFGARLVKWEVAPCTE